MEQKTKDKLQDMFANPDSQLGPIIVAVITTLIMAIVVLIFAGPPHSH